MPPTPSTQPLPAAPAKRTHAAGKRALSDVLTDIANDESRERISVADLLAALNDRALAALLLIFALPNVFPMPPGTSTVLGTPLIFLTGQLALGIRPWLPKLIGERSMSRVDFASLMARASPWLARAEKLLRPRLTGLTAPLSERAIGAVCLFLAVVLVLPIPLGNMLPALAICLFSLGVLERDGLWVIAGALTTVAAISLVAGVLVGVVKATIFLFANALG